VKFTVFIFSLLFAGVCFAETSGSSALQASNLLNPNVSVITWFQGHAGNDKSSTPAFQLREAEIGFQAVVDPFTRADIFVSVEDGGASAEEAYLTFLTLPAGLQARLGRFRSRFGAFNPTHRGETAFADRPLAAQEFFGNEGLTTTGGELSWLAPLPFYLKLEAEAGNAPPASEVPVFDEARRKDIMTIERASSFWDIADSLNASFGVSGAQAPAGQSFDAVSASSQTLRANPWAADLTFRWKNPSRAIYRSVTWQSEWYGVSRETAPGSRESRQGLFSHVNWQFARRWHLGYRHDWVKMLAGADARQQGGLAYLTFTPSEFALLSLQGRETKLADGTRATEGFFKATWSIGPHGAHPF
jgi:hypothetical protein